MGQANIEIVKSAYAAFGRGDIAAILGLLADDVVWITPGAGLPTEGTRHGKAEVASFFEADVATWNFTGFEAHEYVASGDVVVAIGSVSAIARSSGRELATDWVMVWKICDGKVAYFREYIDTLALATALTACATTAGRRDM